MTRNDRMIRVLLSAIAALLAANLLVAINQSSGGRIAMAAGIPDQGAQLQVISDQVADLGKKVDKLDSFLEGGSLSVKIADKKSDK